MTFSFLFFKIECWMQSVIGLCLEAPWHRNRYKALSPREASIFNICQNHSCKSIYVCRKQRENKISTEMRVASPQSWIGLLNHPEACSFAGLLRQYLLQFSNSESLNILMLTKKVNEGQNIQMITNKHFQKLFPSIQS